MKKIYCILFIISLLSCNPYKSAYSDMEKGDYAAAFDTSIKVFKKNSSQQKKDKQLVLLQNSYIKANEKNEQTLNELKSNIFQTDYKKIYYVTKSLYDRVNAIKPLLPLYYDNRELKFPLKDYSSDLNRAKENYLGGLYDKALNLLLNDSKKDARQAYSYFSEVKNVDNNYRDVSKKQQEAYNKGLDIYYVMATNQTGIPIPGNFAYNLTRSITFGVDNFWSLYTTDKAAPYDYTVNVVLRKALVGDDVITTHTYDYSKQISDGWEYMMRNGVQVKDSLGNPIKVTRYINVRAREIEYVRYKEAFLGADVQIYSSYTGKITANMPISSNYYFRGSYSTVTGDIRAIDKPINTVPPPFPSNYDMINQCGIDLRRKLIEVLKGR